MWKALSGNPFGTLWPVKFEPFPKNPLIASFFRNIGYSKKLGSGA
jgi:ATP-dependent DNA helicase RecG